MTKKLLAAPLALLALAGCTTDLTGHGTPAADTTSHASARPSPTPTAMTLAEAGAKYQELVAETNAATYATNVARQAYVAHPSPGGFQALTQAEGKLADAEKRFVAGLSAARWPAKVQPAVDALVAAMGAETANVRRLAETDDWSAYAAARPAEQQTNAACSAAAAALRALLGISGVPDVSPTGS